MAARLNRTLIAFIVAVVVGFLLASVLHSQFVLARLSAVGAEIGMGDRLAMTLGDILGLGGSYGLIIGIALAVGFLVAWIVKRCVKRLASVAYPLAGAAAIALALFLMHLQFEMTPVAGARGPLGFLAQCLAGALAGFVFAQLRPKVPARGANSPIPATA
jgi:hypothetical protein